jgi:hypothetical protein
MTQNLSCVSLGASSSFIKCISSSPLVFGSKTLALPTRTVVIPGADDIAAKITDDGQFLALSAEIIVLTPRASDQLVLCPTASTHTLTVAKANSLHAIEAGTVVLFDGVTSMFLSPVHSNVYFDKIQPALPSMQRHFEAVFTNRVLPGAASD